MLYREHWNKLRRDDKYPKRFYPKPPKRARIPEWADDKGKARWIVVVYGWPRDKELPSHYGLARRGDVLETPGATTAWSAYLAASALRADMRECAVEVKRVRA